jgi:hypothetical protein
MKAVLSAGLCALALASLSAAARAEVVDQSPAGFEVRHEVAIAASPDAVYAALLKPALWWSSAHTFSGSAANLSIDRATGCFCETLPKGFVRHMSVIAADGSTLRLEGALGPMQFTGAFGHLSFVTSAKDGGTDLVVTFDAGGYAKGGLAETLARPVDAVLGEQVARLKAYMETGKTP